MGVDVRPRSIRVAQSDWDRWGKEAKRRGLTISDVVHLAVPYWLENEGK
jgi:hypothetical protein